MQRSRNSHFATWEGHLVLKLIDFGEVYDEIATHKRPHLLLGNGFSIAVKPDIFSYSSLYENADFSKSPEIQHIFDELNTKDFEKVIQHLVVTEMVARIYDPGNNVLHSKLRDHAHIVKESLVSTIAKHHPERPYALTDDQYASCRSFLFQFGHKFTLNYDVLLYWSLMHEDVDDLNLSPDDGFRNPDEYDPMYVTWQKGNSATVNYLHGALHLFDKGTDIIKYTWSKTAVPLVDQIRSALDQERYPLFVAEGSSDSKWHKIMHNAYLHKAYRSFESCTGPKDNTLLVFGHSLAPNDDHILKCISKGRMRKIAVGVFGAASDDEINEIESRAKTIQAERRRLQGDAFPLDVLFFDTRTARVWG